MRNNNRKVFVFFMLLVAAFHLFDFTFYGFQLHELAISLGFTLLAYGAYKDQESASIVGGILAIAGYGLKHFL